MKNSTSKQGTGTTEDTLSPAGFAERCRLPDARANDGRLPRRSRHLSSLVGPRTLALAGLLAAVVSGCGGGGDATPCVDGQTSACACAGGATGVQSCSGGTYGVCECGGGTDAGTDAGTNELDGGTPDNGVMVGSGESVSMTVGTSGATLVLNGASITIPAGALAQDTMITVTETTMPTPAGYRAFSPLYRFEPEGTVFVQPVQVTLPSSAGSADVPLATLFWSRATADGGGWERLGGIPAAGEVTGDAEHFSYGFIADGVDYTETPDRSCVRTRVLDNRTATPSGVALFFAMEDCWGRPITDLSQAQLDSGAVVVEENGVATSSEAQTTLLERRGLQVFVTLSIDMSTSTTAVLPDVIAAARQFVETIQEPSRGLVDKVQIGIQLFAGEATPTMWQPYTLDLGLVLTQLDALTGYTAPDPGSTNLHGGIVDATSRSSAAQQAFRTRNEDGAFTSGYVVLFTDGADTAGLVSAGDALLAIGSTTDQVLAVGLEGRDYNEVALQSLVGAGSVIDSPGASTLGRDFSHLAVRIAGQVRRTYLLGYCSPKRTGTHTVNVSLDGATSQVWGNPTSFDATGFGPGCTASLFANACAARECGGLGCGACDDRVAECELGACVNHCDAAALCGDVTFTNPRGYSQLCSDRDGFRACDGSCRAPEYFESTADCGVCDNACTTGGTVCSGGSCQCPLATPDICAGTCVNRQTSNSHCGPCGTICDVGAGEECTSGVCVECPLGGIFCGGVCRTDVTRCCGNGRVEPGEFCEMTPTDGSDPCPTDPSSDCDQSIRVTCIEGAGCSARCVPRDALNPSQLCP